MGLNNTFFTSDLTIRGSKAPIAHNQNVESWIQAYLRAHNYETLGQTQPRTRFHELMHLISGGWNPGKKSEQKAAIYEYVFMNPSSLLVYPNEDNVSDYSTPKPREFNILNILQFARSITSLVSEEHKGETALTSSEIVNIFQIAMKQREYFLKKTNGRELYQFSTNEFPELDIFDFGTTISQDRIPEPLPIESLEQMIKTAVSHPLSDHSEPHQTFQPTGPSTPACE